MYYNLQKVAEVLSLNTGDVNRLREQGKLKAYRDGSDWKFRKEDVDQYLIEMVKQKSAGPAALTNENDGEGPGLESDAFDLAFELADEDFNAPAQNDGLTLAKEDDGLALAKEDDGGLTLAKEDDSVLSAQESALAEDGSSDGLSLSNSDSGLSLLDDIGGSGVDLAADAGEVVLGGSGSGSGSGSGLNLASDSGLALLGDSDSGFELAPAAGPELSLAKDEPAEKEDDSVFQLADESPASILNLDKDADTEAPTELAADESVFELSTQSTEVPQSSESMSSSVFTTDEPSSDAPNPFVTDDSEEDDGGIFGLAEDPTPVTPAASASESHSIDVIDEQSGEIDDPFMTDESTDSPFASDPMDLGSDSTSSPFNDPSSSGLMLDQQGQSDDGFAGFGGASDSFGSDSFGSSSFGSDEEPSFGEPEAVMPGAAPISSTQYTGKDLIFLVPCLIFLIVATIGAVELCRTIWSYEDGTFSLGAPLLEAIAKMCKMM